MGQRRRQLIPVGLVLALTLVGFFLARAFGEADARTASAHRAELAATQMRDRVDQAGTLVDGVRRFLVGHSSPGVATEDFAAIGARWLSPAGVPAAAWIEVVSQAQRAGYERRTGHQIVAETRSGAIAPASPSSRYLPARLVTGIPPLGTAGLDLKGIAGMEKALARPQTAYRVVATSLVHLRDGTSGLFLVQAAQRLDRGVVEPGFAVLFVPASWLLAAAADTVGSSAAANPRLQVVVGGVSAGGLRGAATARSTFTAAGQRFDVLVPRGGVHGPDEVLPWIILGAGLVLAALAGALGVIAARRAKAKADVDRLFTISPDIIVVAGFDGYFKRVNPAFERLGYTEQEALTRPFVEFVHPDDREATNAKHADVVSGETTVSFENRYVCRDGSIKWIEWTAVPVLKEELTYAVGRDVTERRQAETDLRDAEERNRALAEEQAALRRVATLVARGVPPEELFAAVTEEVGELLPVGSAAMGRCEPDGMYTTVAAWSAGAVAFPVGRRWAPGGKNVMTMVLETGRPARLDSFDDASGPVGVVAQEAGYRSAVGTPITVEGRVWGVMTAASSAEDPLPPDTETRLASFTDLVATAIANAENRAGLARLADEQAALRRVATLVAEGVPPPQVFSALCQEVNRLVDAEATTISRLEPDGHVAVVAIAGSVADESVLGARLEPEALPVTAAVLQTGRSARKDDYGDVLERNQVVRDAGIRSGVGVPIVVEGALWGAIGIGTVRERFPEDTEQRLEKFTELAATAIANTESRAGLARLAEEQAALRRVATLVARGSPSQELFAAVVEEVHGLLPVEIVAMGRYESDATITTVAVSGDGLARFPVGSRYPLGGKNVSTIVARTARPARVDSYADESDEFGSAIREASISAAVGTPIVVDGRLWGVMTATSIPGRALPPDTEERLASFTELLATAIANAESRSEVAASRARIVAASDETRRRIERDLHDGTQQRLITLGMHLRLAESSVPPELGETSRTIGRIAGELERVMDELREISRGIHPAILSEGGLGPALRTLARRSAIPVELGRVVDDRLPEPIEVAAYYVASEALTNATKHANASRVDIEATARGSSLRISIRDDGVGGAEPRGGSGLLGLRDRVEALGGSIEISSPPGRGTHVFVLLPLDFDLIVDESEERAQSRDKVR